MRTRKKRRIALFTAISIALFSSIAWLAIAASITQSRAIPPQHAKNYNKPVIVLLYDSLHSETLLQQAKAGHAPAFAYLMKHGKLYDEVVSSYPTMSVSIDSTLLTGTYADQHHIPGLLWFNEQEQKIISYGSGPHEVWDNGVKNVMLNGALYLNQQHLSSNVQTLYEQLADQQIASASINGIIYRGRSKHTLHPPKLLARAKLLPNQMTVAAPDNISIGLLSQYNKRNDQFNYVWKRVGFNDQFTINELSYLIRQQALPAFTLAYLPDADATLHKHGPYNTNAIHHADHSLQQLLNCFSSWEAALDEAIWIVLGDSSQSGVGKAKEHSYIDLEQLLAPYTLWNKESTNSQLALALNERMAYIHILDPALTPEMISQQFEQEERIHFIAWVDNQAQVVKRPTQKNQFIFAKNGSFTDPYKQSWSIEGDSSILDIMLNANSNHISYGQYPDALSRLYGALHAQQGNIVIIDAEPGYEFHDHNSFNHAGGGSHGSLHRVDSIVPLIAAGTSKLLEDQRIVALQQWLLELVKEQQLSYDNK